MGRSVRWVTKGDETRAILVVECSRSVMVVTSSGPHVICKFEGRQMSNDRLIVIELSTETVWCD